ncbi:unnamed protein product [Closterium sp. Yama58-4]|nr:unnamed protein product [Closterium sp. Yama58-4]
MRHGVCSPLSLLLQSSSPLRPIPSSPHLTSGQRVVPHGVRSEAAAALQAVVRAEPQRGEAWRVLGDVRRDMGEVAEAERCYGHALKAFPSDMPTLHSWVKLLQSTGRHREVISLLSKYIPYHPTNVELHYWLASSHHSLAVFPKAVDAYNHVLKMQPRDYSERQSHDMAFYQREVAIYMAACMEQPLDRFSIDDHFLPLFKESWTYRYPPDALLQAGYEPTALPPLDARGANGSSCRGEAEGTRLGAAHVEAVDWADRLGGLIQYHCAGFLNNRRQQRAAGLAMLAIMQTLRHEWARLLASTSRPASASSGADVALTWRDVYSMAATWRQVAEPTDKVMWSDRYTERGFNKGVISSTPISYGQSLNFKYGAYADRAFVILKQLLLERGVVKAQDGLVEVPLTKAILRKAQKASTHTQLAAPVGQPSFYTPLLIPSSAQPGKLIEGTRISVFPNSDSPEPELAIELMLKPERWREYEREMDAAWQAIRLAVANTSLRDSDLPAYRKAVQDSVLRMAYYWYNFQPLSRGTSGTGYVVTLALLLSMDLQVTTAIPPGVQVDWEALLSPTPADFTAAISELGQIPLISDTFPCLREVFLALE